MSWRALQLWYQRKVLPGFGLTLGITVAYLGLVVLIPFSATFLRASGLGWDGIVRALTSPRVVASFELSFSISFYAALINAFLGTVVGWVLIRYDFPGRRIVDAIVDLPFALPTAVAGIALTAIYSPNGLIGQPLVALTGLKAPYTPPGIFLHPIFSGPPFYVEQFQP